MKLSNILKYWLVSTLLISSFTLYAEIKGTNALDKDNARTGKWVLHLNKELSVVSDSLPFTYYKVINYVTGKPIGYVNFLYKSGKLYFQTPVKALDPDVYSDGKIRFLADTGDTIKTLTYRDGVLNGEAKYFFPNGKPSLEGYYKDNKQSGLWKKWDENGGYGIGSLENEMPEGTWTYYYPDGAVKSEGKFSKGKQTGIWTEYKENGDNASGNYSNGFPEGTWTGSYQNGNPSFKGNYTKGRKDGYWQEWDLLGNRSEGSYDNNEREGLWALFDATGLKMMEGSYLHSKENGQWKKFDSLGNAFETMEFNNGVKVEQ
jgi:antitoxin component YwqK of YwqJK toxin-antitoxin module